METFQYLDQLLLKYSNNYDIYKPYCIGELQYPAYGYFFSHNEKYILVQEANMWTMDSFEHVVFMEADIISDETYDEAAKLITEYMEENMVRKGEKYPGKNHMSSILTVIILGKEPIEQKVQKRIRKFHFDKGYKFHMRGFCRGRMAAVSMQDRNICMSSQAKDLKTVLEKVFQEVDEGKEGFSTACEQQGVAPFVQER